MDIVYSNIRKIRTLKSLSQQNMADELLISQRHYGRIENGHVDIAFSMLRKIARILEVNLQVLIGIEEIQIFNNYNQNQQNGHFIANNATDVHQVKELYERLLKEKDLRLSELLKK